MGHNSTAVLTFFVILASVGLTGCASSGAVGGGAGRGARWTIQCLETSNPAVASRLEQIAEALKTTPGIKKDRVFVMHRRNGRSGLYYGRYVRPLDRKTKRRSPSAKMRADLVFLRELVDDSQRRLFFRAIPIRMPQPDVGDPAWSLDGAEGLYTLHVAMFQPTDEFSEYKQAAWAYCKLLRDRGYEAYYHHTEASSSVTVGSYGTEALATGLDGRTYYSAPIQALQQDELLQYNLVNGAIVRVREAQEGKLIAVPSRLVEIPRRSD